MSNKRQRHNQKLKNKALIKNEYFKAKFGVDLLADIFKGDEKKFINGHSTISEVDRLEEKAWYRHNEIKQNHMNAHARFIECCNRGLTNDEIAIIGISNGGGSRKNIDKDIIKNFKK